MLRSLRETSKLRSGPCGSNGARAAPNSIADLKTPRLTDKTSELPRYLRRHQRAKDCARALKFNLIDKIESITDDKIVAVKYVSLAEEYLADHFPTFPVLPGVMMLEALVQAAGWILHRRNKFAKAMTVLKEARNVKYGTFVALGNSLEVEVEYFKPSEGGGAVFKATGFVRETQAVSARIELS